MKKKFLFIPIVLVFLSACSSVPEKKIVEAHQKSLEITFAFNTESYPWLLGTKYPQLAVWVESDEDSPETVFVTQGAGEDKWMFAYKRPGALPVWTGVRRGEKSMKIDAVSGATPSGETHTLIWEIPEKYNGKKLTVFIEANVSFDYNDFYSKDEGSPGFSDVNGQPSVVWKSAFKVGSHAKQVTPQIIGHGQVLGENSAIDPDMSAVTTAVELFNYINMVYHPGLI